ncbi:MAG: AAA family ATPase [Cyclobacteriaceae bacterium]
MSTHTTTGTEADQPAAGDLHDTLHGRGTAYQELTVAFARCRAESSSQLVLIKGPSGVGKTTLVHHLQSGLAQEVFFLEGKYSQYNQSQPFQAITQILEQFEHRVAALPAGTYKALKARWQNELGPCLQLLHLLTPSSGLLAAHNGQGTSATDLATNQTQLREALVTVFRHMAQVCEAMVVFMDDLQWADKDSIETLQSLWLQLTDVPVLFVASCRSNEAGACPHLQSLAEQAESRTESGRLILLESFTQQMVVNWLAGQLKEEKEKLDNLGDVIWRKTMGNPFYLNQFYQLLMDNASISGKGDMQPWEWNLQDIEAQPGTENLVPALRKRLESLNHDTLDILKWAACLGSSFDMKMLSALTGLTPSQLDRALEQAKQMEFVLHRISFDGSVEYAIAHDQIQQSVYDLLSDEEKARRHRLIAQKIIELKDLSPSHIYQVANHLSLCKDPAGQEEIRIRREYNLKAGTQALASTAYTRAYGYLKQSLGHFCEEDWIKDYEGTLDFHMKSLECAGYNNDVESCNHLFDNLSKREIRSEDKIRLLQLYSLHHIYFKEYKTGYYHARTALEDMGIDIADTPEQMEAAMGDLVQFLGQPETIARFEDLQVSDKNEEIVNTLFNQLCVYAYNVAPQDIAYYTFLWARTTLDTGISPAATDAYSFVAMVYTSMLNMEVAFKYGELTERVALSFDHPVYKNKGLSLVYSHNLVWNHTYEDTLRVMEDTYPHLIRFGEWIWAGGTLFNTFVVALSQGADMQEAAERHERFFRQYAKPEAQQVFGFMPHEAISMLIEYLTGTGSIPDKADALLKEAKETNPMISSIALTIMGRLYTLAGDYTKALEVAEANYPAMVQHGACGGQIHNLVFHFDYALALARNPEGRNDEKLDQSLDRLALYARLNPDNYGGYHTLALANATVARGNKRDAYGLFMEAVRQAQAGGMALLAAMAFEHLGELAENEGLHIAKGYFIEAFHLYRQCGAEGKSTAILHSHLQGSLSQMVVDRTESAGEQGTVSYSAELDVKALMDSSLALSRQVKLDQLMRQLMEIISRNTSAERVVIALMKNDALYLEGVHSTDETRVLEEIPLSKPEKIPEVYMLSTEIVNTVANTSNTVLLGSAHQAAGPYKNTEYIRSQQPKSILCMPLIHQGDLMGALYLENNSQTYAFTRDRLEILTLLSAQMTTSLRNAGMYSNLEAKIAQRTHELQLTNRELEAMSEFREKLTGLIAHDLKSPLSKIIGLSEQIPGQETHQKINQLSRYMEQMILDILETRRLESPEMKPVLKEMAAGRLIDSALEQMAWIIEDRHIRITVEGYTLARVMADNRLIVRVIVNLINNGIVHNPDSRQITLAVEKEGNTSYRISVTDQGRPMPADVATSIFEPYQSHAQNGPGRFRSTGLGLTYCKLAVESHQGKIGVEAGKDIGNTFWFTLPSRPGQVAGEATRYEFGAVSPGQSLTAEEADMLLPYVNTLTNYQVNQLTAILTTLRKIDHSNHPALKQWVEEVEQATYACDEPRYRELLDLIAPDNATEQ